MQLPILSYGHDLLRKQCEEIDANFPDLNTLIDNMWETKGQVKAKYPMTFAK